MAITSFTQLIEAAKAKGPKKLAIAFSQEAATILAARKAYDEGIAIPILMGDVEAIKAIAAEKGVSLDEFELIQENNERLACVRVVEMARNGEVDLIMNGLAQPGHLLRAALDKEKGLRTAKLVTDVSIFEIPGRDKLLFISDIGVVVSPTLEEKVSIVQNAIDVAHALGIECPKVAILAATEMVNPKIPVSMDAANLAKMAQRGQIRGGIVDGPLALDNAISPRSAAIKGIRSEVAGDADIIIAPDIEAGNILAKAITYFAKGKMAGVAVGARCPLVLPSRADPPETKFVSIALGVYLCDGI
ncbi:MAG TPA: bifunctional enoyl-CoA hydratase/phosphate acetyltransferase [Chloroflexi bacterium]|nr:bifunctional enoyl-CoA hydratase/phosphate acetyltransferase [Chloroflexota bacterium]